MPSQEDQQEKLTEALGSGAYKTARNFAIDVSHDVWIYQQTELEVELIGPNTPGSYPLIIYLPSLGEDAGAGRLWRETWAKAGYLVFSMQPVVLSRALKALEAERRFDDPEEMPDDENVELADENMALRPDEARGGWFGDKPRRQSRSARESELHYVGHQYFATENLKIRLEQLFWAYRQVQTRAGLRQPLYGSADLSKVILAGYDLGAQTVAAALGESFGVGLPHSDELRPVAAIVLSPSVDLAEGNVRSRFQALRLPMLTITGSEDNDPYAISSAAVRTAVWEQAPAGGKYLLLLRGAGHRLLAGNELGGRFGLSGSRRGESDMGGMDAGGGAGGHGGGRRGMSGGGPGGGLFGKAERRDPNLGYKQVAAIASVSSAFLDMLIKKDEFALAWLNEKASKWLDRAGSLQTR
ncbi:alpha/beta hydrolase [Methylomonas albis]|uniref:Alpha/beta hydrolase n=1 Tax=Methylomonas albis TaxID=1854563 RepID=A0ABR9CWX9_9GAMM|nr:hypothetical protein [Methylomonas albis]MBD9355230.1 hypothetical protein [Methylomonas albis]